MSCHLIQERFGGSKGQERHKNGWYRYNDVIGDANRRFSFFSKSNQPPLSIGIVIYITKEADILKMTEDYMEITIPSMMKAVEAALNPHFRCVQ